MNPRASAQMILLKSYCVRVDTRPHERLACRERGDEPVADGRIVLRLGAPPVGMRVELATRKRCLFPRFKIEHHVLLAVDERVADAYDFRRNAEVAIRPRRRLGKRRLRIEGENARAVLHGEQRT